MKNYDFSRITLLEMKNSDDDDNDDAQHALCLFSSGPLNVKFLIQRQMAGPHILDKVIPLLKRPQLISRNS